MTPDRLLGEPDYEKLVFDKLKIDAKAIQDEGSAYACFVCRPADGAGAVGHVAGSVLLVTFGEIAVGFGAGTILSFVVALALSPFRASAGSFGR